MKILDVEIADRNCRFRGTQFFCQQALIDILMENIFRVCSYCEGDIGQLMGQLYRLPGSRPDHTEDIFETLAYPDTLSIGAGMPH